MRDRFEEIWEQIYLQSSTYNVGDPYPTKNFDFYIEGVTENNVYFSNEGIKKQIDTVLELNPDRKKLVYFYYERINNENSSS